VVARAVARVDRVTLSATETCRIERAVARGGDALVDGGAVDLGSKREREHEGLAGDVISLGGESR
jgi:hypothetical protein